MSNFENQGRQADGIVIDLVELLWSDPGLSAAFVGGRAAWKKKAAAALSVEASEIASAVAAFGSAKLRDLVLANPAGHVLWASVPKGGPTRPGEPVAHDTKYCVTRDCESAFCVTRTCDTGYCESGRAVCRGTTPTLHLSEGH
jgi:hypothetical protein